MFVNHTERSAIYMSGCFRKKDQKERLKAMIAQAYNWDPHNGDIKKIDEQLGYLDCIASKESEKYVSVLC